MLNQRNTAIILLLVVIGAGGFYAYRTFGRGTLVLKVEDPPSEWGPASNVFIQFSEVRVHRADAGNESGWTVIVDESGWVDLTEALNTSKTLGSESLRAGKYNLVRFNVSDAKVTVDGDNHTAPVESGFMTVAIIQGGVTIESGQTSAVTIDITPRVVPRGVQGYKVVPATTALPN